MSIAGVVLKLNAESIKMSRRTTVTAVGSLVVFLAAQVHGEEIRRIKLADYHDKVYASWLGQCIGNMYGLAHEFTYCEEPRTEPITGYEESRLKVMREVDGSFSDDDTDIEYVSLFCMEKYGPEPTYENVAEFWKRCINRFIWVANRSARDLMEKGYLPPQTGRREFNPNWYQIDPQLVCEIWAVTAPGMLPYAAAKADWAAKVTNDDYGTHPTVWYNTMWAAAFFEKDVEKLCQIGYEHVPAGSIFRVAIDDVRKWKAEHGDDWVAVRKKIKEKYHDKVGLPEGIATGRVSALLNGALGVLALLYGEGDFEKTMQYACMAGYDADNQCATLAGMIALMHGTQALPRKFTHPLEHWKLPLNDFYKNRTRDDLPDGRLTDMGKRTARIGVDLVCKHGGRVEGNGDQATLVINTTAEFKPPVEVRLIPFRLTIGDPATIRTEWASNNPKSAKVKAISGSIPPGMTVTAADDAPAISGTPNQIGKYPVEVIYDDGKTTRTARLDVFVLERNLARTAAKVMAAVTNPTGHYSRDLNVLRDDINEPTYDSKHGEDLLEVDFYGYEWDKPVTVARLVAHMGYANPKKGGWFETVGVQYRDDMGEWRPVREMVSEPAYDAKKAMKGGYHFELKFEPVSTTAVRLIGRPGGKDAYTNIAELAVYEK